ncbi:hypothetical protein [Deinococcus wulumuqiensis]|uniref:hypothetical protein n=1 Tax=Deinococcus wulumuqiensis TaxID=980427 RepID=UPI0024317C66|nr:hypothetical protein [Deinococcus wulumuqiensis]
MSHIPTQAATDVLLERQRQQEVEGWTPEHDDQHTDQSLARAASAYVLYVTGHRTLALQAWPLSWLRKWFKPTDHRRTLVKAAALLIAEIERLDRLENRE